MTRLMIYGIILCVGLLVIPTAGIGEKVREVRVVNTPSVTVSPETEIKVRVTPETSLPVTIKPTGEKIPVTVSTVYRFAGYSLEAQKPTDGIVVMHRTCQATFGASARMCTTKEFWKSPDIFYPQSNDAAWIHPAPIAVFIVNESPWILDYTGRMAEVDDTTCHQWRDLEFPGDPYPNGFQVSTTMAGIVRGDCRSAHEVTCCVPATP